MNTIFLAIAIWYVLYWSVNNQLFAVWSITECKHTGWQNDCSAWFHRKLLKNEDTCIPVISMYNYSYIQMYMYYLKYHNLVWKNKCFISGELRLNKWKKNWLIVV